MKCEKCQLSKLHREFPPDNMTEECDHAPLHCLRCVTEHVKANKACSQCEAKITLDNPVYLECLSTLGRLFPEVGPGEFINIPVPSGEQPTLTVAMMGGETTVIPYNPVMSIAELKLKISQNIRVDRLKQRLMYNDTELKENKGSGKLSEFGVPPYATISLIVVLYEIPESFDQVIFDLYWGYPSHGQDYLDASVLLYSGNCFLEVLDFRHQKCNVSPGAIRHSGDVMDDNNRLGHHTINVTLKSIPPHINKLFFTLSAWNSPNISKYKNPSLKFYDASYPDKQLCSDSMEHAAYSQAIIMCSLCKIDEVWKVFSLRKISQGNAKNYGPIQTTIGNIISSGLC
ncbi:predicted protein [Nematostella vectensis]|uniref:Ubiquitin-like domain-containing protein n=1 Tax=Nematostella vectensis TaxID=45351 RepID=A7SF02_NEMVE|nr:uncharacterized protein LOC5509269 isoform X1 [Nematostella vectensis]XP_048578971.1 uncharacterized protein LOC5509269 isoform X2 [Nematostella vectensis]EDO37746.1 predicted protein [Nematostella vectensis]|eukprot:XP_001629809.1 predicted protein [Nematostella vectensis]